MRDKRTW